MEALKEYKPFNKKKNIFAAILLLLSVTLYVLGIIEPLMTTKYQIIGIKLKSQDVTLFDSIRMFWDSSEYLIASIIFVFTFILPISKYIEMGVRLFTGRNFPLWQGVDKWNMIDVFLVAMLLLNFKMNSNFIVMSLGLGTNFIALAVLTRLAAIMLVDGIKIKN